MSVLLLVLILLVTASNKKAHLPGNAWRWATLVPCSLASRYGQLPSLRSPAQHPQQRVMVTTGDGQVCIHMTLRLERHSLAPDDGVHPNGQLAQTTRERLAGAESYIEVETRRGPDRQDFRGAIGKLPII